jgi:hypothetical protein
MTRIQLLRDYKATRWLWDQRLAPNDWFAQFCWDSRERVDRILCDNEQGNAN